MIAEAAGTARRRLAEENGRPPAYGYWQADPLWEDIKSCGTELAVAEFLELPWTLAVHLRPRSLKADVGENTQVRSTKWGRDLPLHDRDSDSQFWVLVYGSAPKFWFEGWGMGWELKAQCRRNPDHWHTGRPALWVPPEKMRRNWDLLKQVAW